MASSKFGTDRIAGLDSQTAPHLLNDDQLQRADNVNYDVYGAAQPEAADTSLLAATAPSGIGSAYVKDSQYTIVKDGANAVKADGTAITTAWGGSTSAPIKVVQGRGEAIIYDGVRARVWDGDVLRALGTMVGTGEYDNDEEGGAYNGPGVEVRVADSFAVTDISLVDPPYSAVLTTDSPHGLVTGDRVYYYAVVTNPEDAPNGIDPIANRVYTVTRVDDTRISLDGSEQFWLSFTESGTDKIYVNSAGFSGTYMYRVSYAVTLPNGNVIESSPERLLNIPAGAVDTDGTTAEVYTTSEVKLRINGIIPGDVSGYILEDGDNAIGTDYTVSIRLWRTRADDDSESYYLLDEIAHADAYNEIDGITYYDLKRDAELGGLWVDGLDGADNGHDDPPTAYICVPFARRLYVVDADNRSRLFPSSVDSVDYYGSEWYYALGSSVSALGVLGDRMLVVGHGQAWSHQNTNGIGTFEDVVLPGYPVNQEAVVSTPYGLLLATNTGLYIWDGVGCTLLSAAVKDDWAASSVGLWHGAFIGDDVVFFNDGDTSGLGYGLKITGASTATERNVTLSVWRRLSGAYKRLASDTYAGTLLGQSASGFYTLFTAGTDRTMTLQSKDHMVGFGRSVNAVLDLGPMSSYSATLTSNMGDTSTVTFTNSKSTRMLVTQAFKQMVGHFFSITLTGTGTVFGWTVDGSIR